MKTDRHILDIAVNEATAIGGMECHTLDRAIGEVGDSFGQASRNVNFSSTTRPISITSYPIIPFRVHACVVLVSLPRTPDVAFMSAPGEEQT